MALDDLGVTIEQSAEAPQSITTDGLTSTDHPLAAQIMADRYLAGKNNATQKNRGLRFSKLLASGPVSDSQETRQGFSSNFSNPGMW